MYQLITNMAGPEEVSDICNLKDCDRADDKISGCCLMCHKMYHYECVNIKALTRSEKVVFACPYCRQAIQNLHSINEQVNNLPQLRQINVLKNDSCKQISDLQAKLQQKEADNRDLHTKVATLTTQLQHATWKEFTQPLKDLVLSDSMLGDVDQAKLHNTKVVPISGGRAETLRDELKKPSYHGARYNNLTIVSGTNDIKGANGDADKVAATIDRYKLKELINDAKAIADNVHVASVCPRQDNDKDLIDPYNVSLQVTCDECDVEYIDNTPIFTLADGTTNDGYLAGSKGPHLTKSGVNKLIRNLKVKVRNPEEDVTKVQRRHPQPNGQPTGGPGQTPPGSGKPKPRPRPGRGRPQRNPHQYQHEDIAYHQDGCVYCNEPGHNSDICRHRDQGGVVCYTCGRGGHKSKHHYDH